MTKAKGTPNKIRGNFMGKAERALRKKRAEVFRQGFESKLAPSYLFGGFLCTVGHGCVCGEGCQGEGVDSP